MQAWAYLVGDASLIVKAITVSVLGATGIILHWCVRMMMPVDGWLDEKKALTAKVIKELLT